MDGAHCDLTLLSMTRPSPLVGVCLSSLRYRLGVADSPAAVSESPTKPTSEAPIGLEQGSIEPEPQGLGVQTRPPTIGCAAVPQISRNTHEMGRTSICCARIGVSCAHSIRVS
jgi:hypothetical protein